MSGQASTSAEQLSEYNRILHAQGSTAAFRWLTRAQRKDHEQTEKTSPAPTATETQGEAFKEAGAVLRRVTGGSGVATLEQRPALDVARELTEPFRNELHPTAYHIHRVLVAVALTVARRRGYSSGTTQVTFHAPAEIVAHYLGMHRTTLWRHLPQLHGLGLLDSRAHKCDLLGLTRNDGTLWAVKIRNLEGQGAKLTWDDFKTKWRDLEGDRRAGRTAFNETREPEMNETEGVQQSERTEDIQRIVKEITAWALPPALAETPLPLTVANHPREALCVVLDVPFADFAERGRMIELAAATVAAVLGANHEQFYRWLLWQMLRLHDQGQDYFPAVYQMLLRAAHDKAEGFSRNASALFTSRLKESNYWELLKATPQTRVAPKPSA